MADKRRNSLGANGKSNSGGGGGGSQTNLLGFFAAKPKVEEKASKKGFVSPMRATPNNGASSPSAASAAAALPTASSSPAASRSSSSSLVAALSSPKPKGASSSSQATPPAKKANVAPTTPSSSSSSSSSSSAAAAAASSSSASPSSLTDEQRRRIAENKQKALEKRRNSPTTSPSTPAIAATSRAIPLSMPAKKAAAAAASSSSSSKVPVVKTEPISSTRKRKPVDYTEKDDDGKPVKQATNSNNKKKKIDDDEYNPADDAGAHHDEDDMNETGDGDDVAEDDDELPIERKKRLRRIKSEDDDSNGNGNGNGNGDDNVASPVATKRKPVAASSSSALSAFGFKAGNGVKQEQKETASSSSSSERKVAARAAPLKPKAKAAKKAAASDADYDVDSANWVRKDLIRDKQKRRPDHPDYDARTCYVPPHCYAKMTPGQKQYWELKSDNMDVVLFFKMGKFYELFDADADLGVKELGLAHMKSSKRAHAGFPEMAYRKYADQLVRLGYRVGRVEQTETPQELKDSNAKGAKRKVVNRSMCSILTPGTLTDPDIIGHDDASYCMSFCEATIDGGASGSCELGICYVDTSTANFYVGQFVDDRQRTRLRTLLAQIRPQEVIRTKDGLSAETQHVLRHELPATVMPTKLNRGTEFWDADRTIAELSKADYWKKAIRSTDNDDTFDNDGDNNNNGDNETKGGGHAETITDDDGVPSNWPRVLKKLRREHHTLAMSAFGGCLNYLRRLLLDKELVCLGNFHLYDPASSSAISNYMVLDGQTLSNLDILQSSEGTKEGSLLRHVDHCSTPFGTRLMRSWLTRPLARVSAINDRLDAVDDLRNNCAARENASKLLKKFPDLERILSRIHANGLEKDVKEIMFTDVNKPKLEMFLRALQGFEDGTKLMKFFVKDCGEFTSRKLQHITTIGDGGGFPDLSEEIDFFKKGFDHAEARKNGFIVPFPGLDPDYDEAAQEVKNCEAALEAYLNVQKKVFKDMKIKYVHRGKEKYQLEIKTDTLDRAEIPDDFGHLSSTKTVRRFHTPKIRALVPKLERAQEAKEAILKDVTRRMFVRFCQQYGMWSQAVKCLAELDCLISLSIASSAFGVSCRPEFVEAKDGKPFLELRQATHPSLTGGDLVYIPNDTILGTAENEPRFVLVSGPNMGGKSTLLRQTCCAVILAQLGCYVPAESCRLTAVDRIFTRVGANDRIMQGQSTFLVELEETATILRHATSRSLVILDELGRGTSTFDGTAIAYSVIRYLSEQTECLTLFSTHYHMLTEEFKDSKIISMYHMAANIDPATDAVTFLYTFQPGACPKSYGMNVASLAGLPEALIARAREMADNFELRLESAHRTTSASPASDLILQIQRATSGKDTIDLATLRALQLQARALLR